MEGTVPWQSYNSSCWSVGMLSLSSHSGSHALSLGGGGTASVFNPYDTTSLHTFIREVFPGALLLEEHQVCTHNTSHCFIHSRCLHYLVQSLWFLGTATLLICFNYMPSLSSGQTKSLLFAWMHGVSKHFTHVAISHLQTVHIVLFHLVGCSDLPGA